VGEPSAAERAAAAGVLEAADTARPRTSAPRIPSPRTPVDLAGASSSAARRGAPVLVLV
jgi:hypothetical protein